MRSLNLKKSSRYLKQQLAKEGIHDILTSVFTEERTKIMSRGGGSSVFPVIIQTSEAHCSCSEKRGEIAMMLKTDWKSPQLKLVTFIISMGTIFERIWESTVDYITRNVSLISEIQHRKWKETRQPWVWNSKQPRASAEGESCAIRCLLPTLSVFCVIKELY